MFSLSSSFIRKRMISLATTLSVSATSLALAHGPTRPHHVRGPVAPMQGPVAPIQYVADRSDDSDETPFLSENDAAMSKMMADMTVKPTGDIDRDFVAMMVPHHQGAIDMAQALLRYGHNEQLRRLAQEIVVTQQQEIAEASNDTTAGACCSKMADGTTARTQGVARRARVASPRSPALEWR